MQITETIQIDIQFPSPKYSLGDKLLTVVKGQVPKTVIVIGMCFNVVSKKYHYATVPENNLLSAPKSYAERELVK